MDLIELFSEYKPRFLSTGEIQMQCPFREMHDADSQKRRQMWVNMDKNLYHCFSCHKRGTATSLLTTKLGLNLDVALDFVTHKFLEELIKEPEKESYVCSPYESEYIINYSVPPKDFIDRGFSSELLRKMQIGIAEVEGEDAIAIPLIQEGKMVGIKFRKIGSKEFWYSPRGFKKRKFIYNEPSSTKIVVVESETDTLQSITNGIPWVGAILGTDLSPWQIKRMERYERIYFAFDNDNAGFMASEQAYWKTRHLDAEILFVPYDASDPGECPRDKWVQGLKGATDYAEYSYMMASVVGDKYFEIQTKAKLLAHG